MYQAHVLRWHLLFDHRIWFIDRFCSFIETRKGKNCKRFKTFSSWKCQHIGHWIGCHWMLWWVIGTLLLSTSYGICATHKIQSFTFSTNNSKEHLMKFSIKIIIWFMIHDSWCAICKIVWMPPVATQPLHSQIAYHFLLKSAFKSSSHFTKE